MKTKKRKNGAQKHRSCDHCGRRFVVANASLRLQDCPHCGELTSAARTKGWWERHADTLFQRLMRHRDTDANGYALCATCGETIPAALGDAGHWHPRSWWSVRWDECNVNFQCRSCNRPMDSWNKSRANELFWRHRRYVVNRHGEKEAERVDQLVEDEKRGHFRRMTLVDVRAFCYGLEKRCRDQGLSVQ